MDATHLARYLDATNLKLDSTAESITRLCEQALEHSYAAICLYPTDIPRAYDVLNKSVVKIATVVGFPSGRFSIASKEAEIRRASELGAHEVDIVMNYHALIAAEIGYLQDELGKLARCSRECDLTSKIIVETCFLNNAQKLKALELCEEANANFIKTSTGFGSAGATIEDIKQWATHRKTIKIKASGGIRTREDALAMIQAGADRLGVSSALAIIGQNNSTTLSDY